MLPLSTTKSPLKSLGLIRSDSAAFDNVLELSLMNKVVTLPEALMMIISESVRRKYVTKTNCFTGVFLDNKTVHQDPRMLAFGFNFETLSIIISPMVKKLHLIFITTPFLSNNLGYLW